MATKTYTHRVAVMVQTQVIMDIDAENDVESIRQRAIEAYLNGEGDQEEGISIPTQVVIYPWLEEGQEPPRGSRFPEPTILEYN